MHYAYAIEMNFDPLTETVLQQAHTELEVAKIGDTEAVSLFKPHISLMVGREVIEEASLTALETFAASTAPFALTFSYLGIFNPSGTAVVYLGVTTTLALLDLHRTFTAQLSPLMGESWAYYSEGVWVPHCTLVMSVKPTELTTAIEICRGIPLPFVARASRVALVRVAGHNATLLGRFSLAGRF